MAATTEQIGIEATCPTCGQSFIVPPPQRIISQNSQKLVLTPKVKFWLWIAASVLLISVVFAVRSAINRDSERLSPGWLAVQEKLAHYDFSGKTKLDNDAKARFPGMDLESARKLAAQSNEMSRQQGVSRDEVDADLKRGIHQAMFPEDAPGGANDRERRREQSRKDSGFYRNR